MFASNDAVPFRFTPNMQRFLGPVFTEGLLATGIMVIGRCLTEPDVCFSPPLSSASSTDMDNTVWA